MPSQFRCSACRRAVGPILEEDALTPRLFICPQTNRVAMTERVESTWEAAAEQRSRDDAARFTAAESRARADALSSLLHSHSDTASR